MDLRKYAEDELKKIDEDRKQAMQDKGFKPFYKLTEGTHELEFDVTSEPRTNTMYPSRMILRAKNLNNNEEVDVSVSRAGPLYRDIMSNIAAGHSKLRINRIGTGIKDSRYSVKPLD